MTTLVIHGLGEDTHTHTYTHTLTNAYTLTNAFCQINLYKPGVPACGRCVPGLKIEICTYVTGFATPPNRTRTEIQFIA